jgi:hypothetical protein
MRRYDISMSLLLLIPVILSLLVLGAHGLRAQFIPLLAACVVLLFLLSVPKRWVMRVVQVVLVAGGLEWVRTIMVIHHERQATGQPWLRMAIILGVVALITAGSAALFETRPLRRRYAK